MKKEYRSFEDIKLDWKGLGKIVQISFVQGYDKYGEVDCSTTYLLDDKGKVYYLDDIDKKLVYVDFYKYEIEE